MENYQNPSLAPEIRAAALLQELSLDEKMSQISGFYAAKPGELERLRSLHPLGAGQVSCLEMRMLENIEDAVAFQREYQTAIMELSPHHIPAIFHMEGLCGAYLPGATSFPSGVGRGSSFDPSVEEAVGEIVGRQERALGITHTLAPVLDIARDPRLGRFGESYGEDPTLVSAMGSAYVQGLQRTSAGRTSEAVAKHFLGSHAVTGGIHGADCEISERTLQHIYAKPFQAAITESNIRGMMPCYCVINGEPVSSSEKLLRQLLREDMGFDGVLVSDYCAIANIHDVQKLGQNHAEAGLMALQAGVDQEVHIKTCYGDTLRDLFASGAADISVLDEAVLRILTAKFRMGLFENPFALSAEAAAAEFHESDAEISRRSALESLVLLKNNGVLPLSKSIKKLAVIGIQASSARFCYGGYTHFSMAEGTKAVIITMAGLQTEKGEHISKVPTIPGTPIQQDDPSFEELLLQHRPGIRNLLEELQLRMPETQICYSKGYDFAGNDCSGHDEALSLAKACDAVIVMLGDKYGTSFIASMGEGIDASSINLPICQETFLQKLAAVNKPVIGVHLGGRPISSNAADQVCDAILEAWTPGEFGCEAIAKVLCGHYNPGGKLPVSVPYHSGQIPVFYNHPYGSAEHQSESIAFAEYLDLPHTPRYCFGHGLSYTTFEYSNLNVSKSIVDPNETEELSVLVTNTGSCVGDEVVQLYVTDPIATIVRPVQELAGFCRIHLAPGDSKRVRFILHPSQFAFWDRQMNWKIEKGEIQFRFGSSSQDIRLGGTLTISADQKIAGRDRKFFAKAEIV